MHSNNEGARKNFPFSEILIINTSIRRRINRRQLIKGYSKAIFIIAALFLAEVTVGQGTIETMVFSKVLNGERKIWISLPQYYELRKDSFHVLYVLDGDNETIFDLAVASKRFLEMNAVDLGDFVAPESIVVGIEQKDRGEDFVDSANAFLRFLSEELFAYIDKFYRTQPYRVIIGHSLGGRFAINAFLARPNLINAIITASPAYGQKSIAPVQARIDSFFFNSPATVKTWYLSTTYKERDRTESNFRPFAESMKKYLAGKKINNFNFLFESFSNFGHAKSPYFSIPNGLNFIYDSKQWYLNPDTLEFIFSAKSNPLASLTNYQVDIKRRYGINPPLDRWLPYLTYWHETQKETAKAKDILTALIDRNPTLLDNFIQLLKLMKAEKSPSLSEYKKRFKQTLLKMNLSAGQREEWTRKAEMEKN